MFRRKRSRNSRKCIAMFCHVVCGTAATSWQCFINVLATFAVFFRQFLQCPHRCYYCAQRMHQTWTMLKKSRLRNVSQRFLPMSISWILWRRRGNVLAIFWQHLLFFRQYIQAPQVSVQETTSKRWMFGHTGLSFTRFNGAWCHILSHDRWRLYVLLDHCVNGKKK